MFLPYWIVQPTLRQKIYKRMHKHTYERMYDVKKKTTKNTKMCHCNFIDKNFIQL